MKKLSVYLISLTSILLASNVNAQTIKFASITANGVIPVADEQVLFSQCSPDISECTQQSNYLKELIKQTKDTQADSITMLDANIREAFLKLPNAKVVRTNLSGEAELECFSTNCLIYASWLKSDQKLFWVDVVNPDEPQEFVPSKAISITSNTSDAELKLYEEMRTLKARLSTGVSYRDFAEVTAPFIREVNSLQQTDKPTETKMAYHTASKAKDMLSVISKTWELYIDSTYTYQFLGATHVISCKNAKTISDTWNLVVETEDITFKKSRGLLGCSVDLGKFNFRGQETTWHGYMLNVLAKTLDASILSYKSTPNIVENIDLININTSSQNGNL